MANTHGEYWVTFDFLDSEARELEEATASADERVGGVVTSEPSNGSATAVFQIEAFNPQQAYQEAEGLYATLRADAGLAQAAPLGGTVTTLREPVIEPSAPPAPPPPPPIYRRLLDKAYALHEAGEHEYATVAAQTACEVVIAAAVRRQFAMQSSILLRSVEGLIGGRWAMTDKRVRTVWTSLTGDNLGEADFWRDYNAHIGRRNQIVHAGGTVTPDEAAASIAVAEKVCGYMVENS
ncbi:MAG TPA: hypothetical protein VGY76_10545 [Solirubrobacteraceae bacterium]|jgi:hypothetical protein|nr:hypothetical protein [Solirubrobacteraceae bacterium]